MLVVYSCIFKGAQGSRDESIWEQIIDFFLQKSEDLLFLLCLAEFLFLGLFQYFCSFVISLGGSGWKTGDWPLILFYSLWRQQLVQAPILKNKEASL